MYKRYLVTGHRRYRWHERGTIFEAQLDPDAERRAIERGSIRVLEEIDVRVANYELPEDWPQAVADARPTESPAGVSLVELKEGKR